MTTKRYTVEEIKAVVEPIARKYGVERIYLIRIRDEEVLIYSN